MKKPYDSEPYEPYKPYFDSVFKRRQLVAKDPSVSPVPKTAG